MPSPLYVMYAQCSAYSQACDPLLEVRVVGDVDEARRFQELVDKLLTSKLAESATAKAGLEDMRLLLSYCKLYTCSEVLS